jgi:Cu/Zn superoxide dismutase
LRRITKAALGGVASCALILGGTQAANGLPAVEEYNYSGALADLQADPGPLDGASATVRIKEIPLGGTEFKLRVNGMNPSAKDQVFGAHLHIGPCVEGDAASNGKHYNTTGWAIINDLTEVWFDVVSNANGDATFEALVPFVPVDSLATDPTQTPGEMSIVIHVSPTNPSTGGAGDKQACLPLSVPQWNTPTS